MIRQLARAGGALAAALAVVLAFTGQAGANPAPTVTQTADCVDVTLVVKNNATAQTIGIRIDGGQQINIVAGQTRTFHAAFGSTHTVQWGYASGAGGTFTVTALGQPQSCTTTTTGAPTTTAAPTSTAAPTTVVESTTVPTSSTPPDTAAPTTATVQAAAAAPATTFPLPPTGGTTGGSITPTIAVIVGLVGGLLIIAATRRPATKGS